MRIEVYSVAVEQIGDSQNMYLDVLWRSYSILRLCWNHESETCNELISRTWQINKRYAAHRVSIDLDSIGSANASRVAFSAAVKLSNALEAACRRV